jgi:hypothetical protein
MSMKNCNDPIGNRTRDLSACNAVPQPTAPPRAPPTYVFVLLSVMVNTDKKRFTMKIYVADLSLMRWSSMLSVSDCVRRSLNISSPPDPPNCDFVFVRTCFLG